MTRSLSQVVMDAARGDPTGVHRGGSWALYAQRRDEAHDAFDAGELYSWSHVSIVDNVILFGWEPADSVHPLINLYLDDSAFGPVERIDLLDAIYGSNR